MTNCVRQAALFAAHSLLLLMVPVTCLAFGGKVSYPNGSPAAGAQVNLIIDDTSKKASLPNGSHVIPPQVNMVPGDMSGNASYSTGSPMTPAQGNPIPSAKSKTTITCDSSGRFRFPDQSFTDAMIQIKAPDGKDFATVTLPAKVFAKGEVAIVLRPKK